MQSFFERIQGCLGRIQGSFERIYGSLERIYGSFERIQGSFDLESYTHSAQDPPRWIGTAANCAEIRISGSSESMQGSFVGIYGSFAGRQVREKIELFCGDKGVF